MAIAIDSVTLKKLVFIKRIYQQALIDANNRYNEVIKTISVIEFDFAIESCLKTIINSLDSTKSPPENFPDLLKQCDLILEKRGMELLPDKAHIQYIHTIRNDAQHKAKYPNDDIISDCRTYARDFLENSIKGIYGKSFESIRISDAVRNNEIQEFLKKGESLLEQNKYSESVFHSVSALTTTLHHVKKAMVGREHRFVRSILVEGSSGKQESNSDILKSFERMQETLLYVSLGMNFPEYMEYKKITGFADVTSAGTVVVDNMKRDITKDDAEFVLLFSTKTIIQIENIVGDIKQPFGSRYWP